MTLVTPPPAIDRDRWGRPLIVPPNGGKAVAYTRCTTYIDVLEDKFNLQKWMQRMVALGLTSRPDLALSVAAHRDDKKALDRICDDAREAAAANASATTGTAIHALTELVDRGLELPPLPDAAVKDIEAYRAATADLKHTHIEQFCVLDTLKIGGTPDRVVEYQGERYIADIKTGSIDFGILKIAMQLAVYARSYTYDVTSGKRDTHGASTSRGIVIHVPAGTGEATLHWVDIEAGWHAVDVARQVREKRALKFKDLAAPFGPLERIEPGSVPGNTAMLRERNKAERQAAANDPSARLEALRRQILASPTADVVRSLWADNEDIWTDDLTEVARQHITTLPAAS